NYGHISRIAFGPFRSLLITDPDHLKEIFLNQNKNFSSKMGYKPILQDFFNNSLITQDGDDHKTQRRIFQNSFKNEAMKGYVDIINPIIRKRILAWNYVDDFHFHPNIKQLLLDIASQVFLGINDIDADKNEKLCKAFLQISEKGIQSIIKKEIPGLAFSTGLKGKRYLDSFIKELIPTRREQVGKDLMSVMVKEVTDDGEYWPDELLISNLGLLLFAAHDTNTSALSHMLLYLAKPEHRALQEELREHAHSLNTYTPSYDDLEGMTGIEYCMMEILRIHPSVIMLPRRTVNQCKLGDYEIPANTRLFLSPYWTQFNPEFWSNPFDFDPKRFSPERAEHKNHSFSFTGFGGGAHKCIGMHFAKMQVKLFMHQFLLTYKFETPKNYNPKFQMLPLPKPADNLPLKLTPLLH
ncbi:MAG: cytochrome P450, partial [Lentisphaeria bacterium]|nr:cytochrome P450 [Lentisphaeria bacterium]